MKGLFRLAVGAVAGLAYGLFFAQKSGKDLRKQLKKSENPAMDLLTELKKTGEESGTIVKQWVEGSEELQGVIATGKEQFVNLTEQAKSLSKEATESLAAELEGLARNAADSAKKLKADAAKKTATLKKDATKKVTKAKKTATKKVTKIKKDIAKKKKT